MLQQTQMERGKEYFLRWVERFPNVHSVAVAPETELYKYWEGLGYYARLRNLHKTAKILTEKFDGDIPNSPTTLQTLPGIGPYTAAAISSIAFNVAVPVVDANVLRVYARVFDIDVPLSGSPGKKLIGQLATELLPSDQARNYNQAVMDLGGVICLASQPQCSLCPISRHCKALAMNTIQYRPIPEPKKGKILIEMATGIIFHKGQIFIQQRLDDDIWGGLWEFPGGKIEENETPEQTVVREYEEETNLRINVKKSLLSVTHFHTKYKVVLHCFLCSTKQNVNELVLQSAQQGKWVDPNELSFYAFPAGHRKFVAFILENLTTLLQEA